MSKPVISSSSLDPLVSRVRTDITAVKSRNGTMAWRRDQPLTPVRLEAHLNNGLARGVCPIKGGSSVTSVALLDLDAHKGETEWAEMVTLAMRVVRELLRLGMKPIVFRSSGGHGIHIYLIWDEPQDAYSVREFLRSTIGALGYKNGTAGVAAKEIEVFPKQDSVLKDGCGSQFILPLAGKSVPLDWLFDLEPMERNWVNTKGWWSISPPVALVPRPESRKAEQRAENYSPDLDELREMLAFIDPDCGRSEWIKVGMALHYETDGDYDGLSLFDEWSSGALKLEGMADAATYKGYDDCEFNWKSFRKDRPEAVTIGTIKKMAREQGWAEDCSADFETLDEEKPPKRKRFEMIPAGEFTARKPQGWLIKKVLPEKGIAMIFGKSGAGKSFFALDMIASIAQGTDWCGHKVKQGTVVYVAAEGAAGFRNRLDAYAQHHDVALESLPLNIIADTPNLRENDDELLIQSIMEGGGASVVVIDTLAQASAGANENSGEDMGAILARCKRIGDETGALVILVHHSGKDEARGARGWSGIRAAMDTEIEITMRGTDGLATITKQKDGETDGAFVFTLKQVALGIDEDGEEITSCVIEVLPDFSAGVPKPKGKWQRHVFNAISDLSCFDDVHPSIGEVISAAIEKEIYDPGDPAKPKRDSRRDSAKRALDELVKAHVISIEGDLVHLPQSRNGPQNDLCEDEATADHPPQLPHNPIGVRNSGADARDNKHRHPIVKSGKAA